MRLVGRVADAYEMTADSEIKIPWGDLLGWYTDREPASTRSLTHADQLPFPSDMTPLGAACPR